MDTQPTGFPKILFVDDEPSVLKAMMRLFHDDPFDVLTASGGAAALELLQESGPVKLIISDHRMPGMSGVEFLQQVMQRWPDIRRIILSGFPDSDVLLAALNSGRVHRFLVKPWDNDEIRTVINEMLGEYDLLVAFRHEAEELARNNRILSRTNEHLSAVLTDVLATMRRDITSDTLPERSDSTFKPTHCSNFESLSSREREILRAIAAGLSLKAIAVDRGISIKTVSTYKKRLFDKMGFKNDAELIGYAIRNNLLAQVPSL
jgi:DNA-binding NarL/FixJ family response regulator